MKDLSGYLTYRLLTGVFGMLPEAVMRRLGEAGGLVSYAIRPGRRRMAQRHMQRLGAPDEHRAAREVFIAYGRYLAELFWARPRRVSQFLANVSVDGMDHVDAAKTSGRGIILALPHMGNWEVAALEAARVGIPVTAVAEVLENRRITEWFTNVRAVFGIEVVLARRGALKLMEERLRDGRTVALVCDRNVKGRGVEVEFFGETTRLPAGPVRLAIATDATILPVGTYFAAGPRHRFVVHAPLAVPTDGTDAERIQEGTQRLAHVLEGIIRRRPSQWHNLQPNWPSDQV